MLDDEVWPGTSRLHQRQSELPLHRFDDGRARREIAFRTSSLLSLNPDIRRRKRVLKLEVKFAGNAGLIDDRFAGSGNGAHHG